MRPLLTCDIVMAIFADVANQRMRKYKRKTWNRHDWNHAQKITAPLFEKVEAIARAEGKALAI